MGCLALFRDNVIFLNRRNKFISANINSNFVRRFKNKLSFIGDCWNFESSINWKGYGRFGVSYNGKQSLIHAHRISYYIYKGDIPKNMTVHHKCHNRRCVNPDHLELRTNDENRLEGNCWSAVNARKTHCKWGHEFDKDNTRIWFRNKNGILNKIRICKKCSYNNNKKYKTSHSEVVE